MAKEIFDVKLKKDEQVCEETEKEFVDGKGEE